MLNQTTKLPATVIAAGVEVLAAHADDASPEELVEAIYRAMSAAETVTIVEVPSEQVRDAVLKDKAQSAGRMFGRFLNRVADYGRDEPASSRGKPKGPRDSVD